MNPLAPLAKRLLPDESLARYTAARLGGNADWLYIARDSVEDLAEVVAAAWSQDVPVRIIGGGANVLISDQGVRGLVVINHVSQVQFRDAGIVSATSGAGLTVLARKCASQGLSGLEWAVSVPGTVGGGVVNNAGAHGSDMAANLVEIELIDAQHGRQTLPRESLGMDYRTTNLKHRNDKRFLVLSATMRFTADDPAAIEARMEANIVHRKRTQPPGASLGSIFKNPPGDYAGRLIESIGLKGYTIGGAQVSPVHANFFINTGNATAQDYYSLIRYVQDAVYRETGIMLEMEVEIVGEWFSL